MSSPLISIIIPTYNRLGYLREALDSVARQTFQNFEVIVVDDGSTEDIAAGVANHPACPTVVRQQNEGPAAARNHGIKKAAADIVAFLDSDDLWHPTKLERFIRALESDPDTRIYYGPMRPITDRGDTVAGRTKPCHAGWITEKLFCSSFVHVPTVVCRKELLVHEGGFDQTLPVCEDYDLWLRLSVMEPFGLVEDPLAMRRLHGDRLSKCSMSRNLAVKARVLRKFYELNATSGRLNRDVCKARLARVCFVAARAFFRNGEYERAIDGCRACRSYGGPALRTIPLALAAKSLARLRGNGRDDPDQTAHDKHTRLDELTPKAHS